MKRVRTALIGLGNVNRSFLKIVETKGARLRAEYGVDFRIVAVADSSGLAFDAAGFDPAALRSFKEKGGRVRDLPGFLPESVGDGPLAAIVGSLDCDLVLEGSPVNLETGEPGLGVTRAALARGTSVVLANKAPLVLAFRELHDLAAQSGAGLAFSATVCGALPVINIGQRDLIGAEIAQLRGIFNATSNFILHEMASGRSYDEALAEAQRRGVAEADPTLDVGGWDTANKLVIIANSFLGVDVTLEDVSVEGMTEVSTEQLQRELAAGNTIKLLATAEAAGDGYHLSVRPTVLARSEFLGQCDGWEMGVEMETDLYGRLYHKIWENDPIPTAAAMLRDAVNLFCPGAA